MSRKHPVIAVTGSSGAGTTTVKVAFEHIFYREQVTPCIVEGDSFHRYDRSQMREAVANALSEGTHLSHFGPAANLFSELEALFSTYGESGTGKTRRYLHDETEAELFAQEPGAFTPW